MNILDKTICNNNIKGMCTKERTSVLILYNKLFHYRIPIFNLLSQKYDLTVAYSYKASDEVLSQCHFKTIYLPINKYWKFVLHSDNVNNICKKYDVVIAYGEPAWLSYSTLSMRRKRSYKLLFWGIGVPASYKRNFDQGNFFYTFVSDFFNKRADGLIFYTDYPIKKHLNRGFKKNRLFVANNTVEVDKIIINNNEKDSILFIGTLYLEKGLQVLLNEYLEAYKINNNIPKLNIVGGGNEFENVKLWIERNNLQRKITLLGPIYDNKQKSEIFAKAYACFSPLQAGLSVLESFGYGVPFVTTKDAITGGEIFNIENMVNGIKLENVNTIKDVILDISNNPKKYLDMGEQAYNYYWNNRKPEDMALGIINAINSIR